MEGLPFLTGIWPKRGGAFIGELTVHSLCLQKDLELVGDATDADDVEDWEDGADEFQTEPIKRDDVSKGWTLNDFGAENVEKNKTQRPFSMGIKIRDIWLREKYFVLFVKGRACVCLEM